VRPSRCRLAVVLAALLASAVPVAAQVGWDEPTRGDLSGSGAAPTPVAFGLGANRVAGRMGRDSPAVPPDADILSFAVPTGRQLTGIDLVTFAPDGDLGGGGSFVAIAAGPTISTDDPTQHLSNALIDAPGDVLGLLDAGPTYGGAGLERPLGAGTYTFWFQETATTVTYAFDFTVAAVPEPTTLALAGAALVIAARRRRQR